MAGLRGALDRASASFDPLNLVSQVVNLHAKTLETFVFDLGQRVVFEDGNQRLLVGDCLEVDTPCEGGGLLTGPSDGEKLEFYHCIP